MEGDRNIHAGSGGADRQDMGDRGREGTWGSDVGTCDEVGWVGRFMGCVVGIDIRRSKWTPDNEEPKCWLLSVLA